MKQATLIIALLGAIVLAGCGGNGDTTSQSTFNNGSGNQPYKPTTHLSHRSLVSNYYSGALQVIDATQDRLTTFSFAVGAQPTYMQPSPDGTLTFANNSGGNSISSLNNTLEAVKGTIQLGGWTQSFVTSTDNFVGFAAVPNYSNGTFRTPGGIVRFNPTDGSLNTAIPFPNVQYLGMDTAEKHLLAFTVGAPTVNGVAADDQANWVDLTTIDPNTEVPPYYTLTLTNSSGNPVSLSRPVAAFFSKDNTKAYILSCGAECGGSSASTVTEINTSSITPPTSLVAGTTYTGTAIAATVLNQWQVSGARIGLIDTTANLLYVAGSTTISTAIDCPFTQLPNCAGGTGGNNVQDGYFTVINLAAGTAAAPIRIGNGVKRWIRNINGVFWVASLSCGVESCVSMVQTQLQYSRKHPLQRLWRRHRNRLPAQQRPGLHHRGRTALYLHPARAGANLAVQHRHQGSGQRRHLYQLTASCEFRMGGYFCCCVTPITA